MPVIAVNHGQMEAAAGQAQYRQQVADNVNNLLSDPNPDFSLGASELVNAIKQVR